MYLDFLVKIPFVQGKITRRKKKDAVYVEYLATKKQYFNEQRIRKCKKNY